MDKYQCLCEEVKWECWIKEYDSDNPGLAPALWYSTECVKCGAMDFKAAGELDESLIPEKILERGRAYLRKAAKG